MRVFYRTCESDRALVGDADLYEQAGAIEFCCMPIRAWWGRLVGFGVRGQRRSTDAGVNLYVTMPQAGGKLVPGMSAIAFCPWCGTAIETRRRK